MIEDNLLMGESLI